ncbi:MAG: hypothetical protein D6781_02290 [Verrucomicrobia bacterium]|nr:MAG: hypothetical protein D6781_02290 [Verrucomicrobiota bacterium]
MPLYEYEIPEAGLRFTLQREVERRDDPVRVVRCTVPRSLAIAGSARNPFEFDDQVQRGYRKLEEEGRLPRRSEFKKTTIADVWPRKD